MPTLTEAQLQRVRDRRSELFAQWGAVAPGGAMELAFEMTDARGAA